MTHPTYSQQALSRYNLPRLKRITAELGITPTGDKRAADTWVNAIITHQSAQTHKVADEQTTAQAQAIAPEALTTVEINSNHYEIYSGKQLIAYIAYDHNEFVTQPWLVMVNGEEKFRNTTVARCQRFISWHHKDGTLNNSQFASRNSQLHPIPESQEFGSLIHQSPHDINNCVSVAGRSPLRTGNCELPQAEVPEVPTISELSFYDQEALVNRELVAGIFYDHDNYKDLYWRVIINDKEIFRDTTSARCHSYVKQQYQQGTLPVQEPFIEEAEGLLALSEGEEISPLHPVSCCLSSSCTTGNEIMAQIFNGCEKYGFEILDNGIYKNDVKLGEVGCTDGGWWFTRATDEMQQRIPCDSALDAVWWLSMVDALPDSEPADCEELLDRPFEMLTTEDWQRLRKYKPVAKSRKLVAA